MRRMLLLFAGLCLPLYLIGYAATTSVTRPITVTVSPTVASVPVGQTQAFIATVTGTPNTGLTWTLTQGGAACSPGCGTISPTSTTSGTATTYTAPATPPAQEGAVTLTATSAADTTKSASATVTIAQNVSISVSPSTANVGVGATQAFTATVTSSVDSPGEAALLIFLIDGVPHPAIPPEIDGVRTRIRVGSRFHAGLEGNGSQRACPVPRPRRKRSGPQPNHGPGIYKPQNRG